MTCTEAYKERIMYTFNGFCKVVIRYAAINAWRDRSRRRKKKYPSLRYAVRRLSSPTENLPPVRGGYLQRRKFLKPYGA